MKFFFGGISLLAVTPLLLVLNKEFALAVNGNLQGSAANNQTHKAAGSAPAEAEAEAAQLQIQVAGVHGNAEEVVSGLPHFSYDDNVVDIATTGGQQGVDCKTYQLLEDTTMYIFTPLSGTPFTTIMSSTSTVAKRQSDISFPAVTRISSPTVSYVIAESKDGDYMHAQDRVVFYKRYSDSWRTAFGVEVLNHLYKVCKKVTYNIDGENSEDDFKIESSTGTSHIMPRPNAFIERVVYKNQVIFEFSTTQALAVTEIAVSNEPIFSVEIILLYPLGGFHHGFSYTLKNGQLHSPSQASKTIGGNNDACPECDKEKAGAAPEADKEAEAKNSGFFFSSGLVTLVVPFFMMVIA